MLSHGRWIAVGAALGVGALLGLWMLAASTGAEAEAEVEHEQQTGKAHFACPECGAQQDFPRGRGACAECGMASWLMWSHLLRDERA